MSDQAPSNTRSRWMGWIGAATAGVVLVVSVVAMALLVEPARESPAAAAVAGAPDAREIRIGELEQEVERVRADLAARDRKLDRLTSIIQYSAAYTIPADVARQIYDAALAEGIHPSLAYQLVKVESGFKPTARSTAAALGYTQIRLRTAQTFDPALTERRLLEPETNLRMGFRLLRRLLRQFDHDLELALKAYNLGPTRAVATLIDSTAVDEGNAYARAVMVGVTRATVSGRNR